ncbi:hypothetical protein FACS189461_5560 [Spirochaetia bacterium]|nr:hypothetical protein FACS189461_5560 [Spirochaetia bacterium]
MTFGVFEYRNMNDQLEKTDNRAAWAAAIYAKYFICDLLPEYDKCIWLDGDIIVMRDLAGYYNTDIRGCYLAGVKSPGTNYNVAAEKHAVLPRGKYLLKCINVGSLLLNLDELRKLGGGAYFLKETFAKIDSLPPKTPVTEQDMFNYLLTDKIVYLPLKYNFMIENSNTPERPYFPFCYDKAAIEEALNEPVIVHYTFKPWKFTNSNMLYAPPYKKYFKIWESYYKASPLGGKKLSRKRLWFFYRLWFRVKPILKSFHFLRKVKRQISKTGNSPIQDFYY